MLNDCANAAHKVSFPGNTVVFINKFANPKFENIQQGQLRLTCDQRDSASVHIQLSQQHPSSTVTQRQINQSGLAEGRY